MIGSIVTPVKRFKSVMVIGLEWEGMMMIMMMTVIHSCSGRCSEKMILVVEDGDFLLLFPWMSIP